MTQTPVAGRRRERVRVLAGVLLVAGVAWSAPGGLVSADTKNDLYVDAWGFLGRSLHLWDPQVTWGVLQNQGYGYLFPMGPFFGVTTAVLPVWVAQRLWWTLLLVGGLLAANALLRALPVGTPATRLVAAVAWTLSPRVLSTLGGLSSEALPALLAPAIALPVVLAARGRMPVRRAAALSGLAVLGCGGVNATATLLATVPTALFLVTRTRWWCRQLTWWWALAAVLASAWWLGPLVVLGRWSPPFLDWIEGSVDVVRRLDAVDVLRGTTHWLEHLVTAVGPWWPAGHELVTVPVLVVATALVGATGVAGLGLPGMPERRWLVATAAVGAVVLLVAHPGPVASPLADAAQGLLDGPLAPLRNVHKADPLVRLPLAVGLAHALAVAAQAARRRRAGRPLLAAVAAVTVLTAVSPGLTGAMMPPGGFPRMAGQWVEAGRWLTERADQGRALVVPAAGFGEYEWGRPLDEPVRPLSTVDYAVRDAVPLTPAGTIRFLDDLEHRLQAGTALGGEVDVLRRLGVRWLVLRNDLDAAATGQPPVALARSAVRTSAGVSLARGFGPTRLDATGDRVFPVEVYDLGGNRSVAVVQPLAGVVGVAGGAEDLARVLESGESGLVVLDGDRPPSFRTGRRVVTDGYRARDRWYGTTRGRDATSTLTVDEVPGSTDYRPWTDDADLASHTAWRGVAAVSASSSVASDLTVAGLRPADRPAAALDEDPLTAWTTVGDSEPTLTVRLAQVASPRWVRVVALRREGPRVAGGTGVATRVRVTTDAGSVTAALGESGAGRIMLPEGSTGTVRVTVLDTDAGAPGEVLTGLATVEVDGVRARELVVPPVSGAASRGGPADVVVLDAGLPGTQACARPATDVVCLGAGELDPEGGRALDRGLPDVGAGSFTVSGHLVPQPGARPRGLAAPGVGVEASTSRSTAAGARPETVLDGDPATAWSPAAGDRSPRLSIRLPRPVDVDGLRLDTRRGWADRYRPFVEVSLDGRTTNVRATTGGVLRVSGRGVRTIGLRLVLAEDQAALAGLELAEVEVLGADVDRPAGTVRLACGAGPELTVGGRSVPTRASGPRSALWGEGALEWQACGPVRLDGPADLVVEGVDGWQPASAVLRRDGDLPAGGDVTAAATALDARWVGDTRVVADVPSGPARLLALDTNTNPGWVATLGGTPLEPVVVDGFRQGFLVPDGASGPLDARFGPDPTYRTLLAVGLVLALLLPLSLLLPPGPRRPARSARRAGPPLLVAGLVVAAAGLLVGPWGALVTAAGLGVAAAARRPDVAAWAGGATAALGGLVVAGALVVGAGGEGVEAASTLLVVTGAALAAGGSVWRPSASPGARRTAG
jgi:arabinofuranan 3-O-arabinosyltransferase